MPSLMPLSPFAKAMTRRENYMTFHLAGLVPTMEFWRPSNLLVHGI